VAGDEHVLVALVGERLTGEAAVERRHLQARYVQQSQSLVLRRPPQGAESLTGPASPAERPTSLTDRAASRAAPAGGDPGAAERAQRAAVRLVEAMWADLGLDLGGGQAAAGTKPRPAR
jgi:hypothetical protein